MDRQTQRTGPDSEQSHKDAHTRVHVSCCFAQYPENLKGLRMAEKTKTIVKVAKFRILKPVGDMTLDELGRIIL